ncbi:MAG: ribonuclease III [Betaproteobacteria bacterium TMED156]|nr:MAG: ribonuclease III [Betaproteobacteria bacterium TMED156]
MSNEKNLNNLEILINYKFRDKSILKKALTHRSYSSDHNERLELLGDSALNLAITFSLFHKSHEFNEGDLSRLRSTLVCQKTLNKLALSLSLNDYVFLGDGAIKNGGNKRPSILADTFEAILGGIIVDSDFSNVFEVIKFIYEPLIKEISTTGIKKDPKTELQELLQKNKISLPQYSIASISGAHHEQIFKIKCDILKLNISTFGLGESRKDAEIEAANGALILCKQKFNCKKN